MLDGYTFMKNHFGPDFENMFDKTKTNNDTIINYEEKELYELLISKNVSMSAINQIMKLHNVGYALNIDDITKLSTDDLREISRNYSFACAC